MTNPKKCNKENKVEKIANEFATVNNQD